MGRGDKEARFPALRSYGSNFLPVDSRRMETVHMAPAYGD
jgi:hypothetical protein